MTADAAPGTVALCCDAGADVGVGHVLRCLALAEELAARQVRPVFVCDLTAVPWVGEQLARRGFPVVRPDATPAGYVHAVRRLEPVAVVVDSYRLGAEVTPRFSEDGLPVVAIVDGDTRGQRADLYVDQNLGADDRRDGFPPASTVLAGARFAMLRDDVLALRPAAPPADRGDVEQPRVVAFFGGTDASGAAPVVAGTLAATGRPFTATVVASRADLVAGVRAVGLADGQRIEVIPPTADIAALAADADLVLAAAGTSVWELLCLGAAAAVVRVADNQAHGYERVVSAGAVAGLGALADLRADPSVAVHTLTRLLAGSGERTALRRTGWYLVDGHGRQRVAAALLGLTATAATPRPGDS